MYESTPELIWWNGRIVPWESAKVHVTSEVATRGMNLFEGLRCYWQPVTRRHAIIYRDRHFRRLRDSARITRLPIAAAEREIDTLRIGCDLLVRALGYRADVYLRPTVYIDVGRYGWREEDVTIGSYVAGYLAEDLASRPVRCIVSSWRRSPDLAISPLIKVGAAYQAFRLPRIEASLLGADEAIVLNQRDTVAETGGAAVFIARRGEVITPPLADGVLDSITREAVIRLLRSELGRTVIERSIPRTELYAADEIFLCGTMDEIRSVVALDGFPLADGPIAQEVRESYLARCRGTMPPLDEEMLHLVETAVGEDKVDEPDAPRESRPHRTHRMFPVVISPRLPQPNAESTAIEATTPIIADYKNNWRPSCVLFDVGLTLIHPSGTVMAEEIAALRPDFPPRPPQELVAALVLAAEARHLAMPAGLDGEAKVARMWGHFVGLAVEDAERVWHRLMSRTDLYRELDPDATTMLEQLRDLGLTTAAVSNSDGTLMEEMRHFGLQELVDVVIDSTVVGIEKPARGIFDAAMARLGVEPAACCFVGDGPVNDLLGARNAGIPMTVLYDRFNVHQQVACTLRLRELRELPPHLASMPS